VPIFTVLAIHESYQDEVRVNQAFGWFHDSFRSDIKLAFYSWNFAKLENALDIRAMSVRIGTTADIIIIATSGVEPIPEHITRWLGSIMQQRQDNRFLILALEEGNQYQRTRQSTLFQYVQDEAVRWQANFIACEDLHLQMNRQFIFRFINDKFNHSLFTDGLTIEEAPNPISAKPQHIRESQSSMSSVQIQEIRTLAYRLWLQARRSTSGLRLNSKSKGKSHESCH